MNEKNFEYLSDQVKYTGFGEGLAGDLREKLQEQSSGFTLTYNAQYGQDTAVATLNFRKSDQSDMYFFNSYKVSLQKADGKDALEQTFYINKGNNITMKEAYNLMEGRTVNKDLTTKEGEVYNAWVQLDFKETDAAGNFKLNHFHQNYGYDLEAAVSKHPIKELDTPRYKEDLMDSLKKGNLQSATFIKDGTEVKHYIEANPQFKTVNVYDGNQQRLDSRQSKAEKQAEGEGKSEKKENRKKQDLNDESGPDVAGDDKKKRKKQNKSL